MTQISFSQDSLNYTGLMLSLRPDLKKYNMNMVTVNGNKLTWGG